MCDTTVIRNSPESYDTWILYTKDKFYSLKESIPACEIPSGDTSGLNLVYIFSVNCEVEVIQELTFFKENKEETDKTVPQ